MDHLPTPANPHNPIVVPYYDGELYDGKGFASYPARRGRKYVEFLPSNVDFLQKIELPDSIRFLKNIFHKLSLEGNLHHTAILDGVISLLYTVLVACSPSKGDWQSLEDDMIRAAEFVEDLSSRERLQQGVRLLKSLQLRHEQMLSKPTLFDAQRMLKGIYSDGDRERGEPIEAWRSFFQDLSFAMANDESWKTSKRTERTLHKEDSKSKGDMWNNAIQVGVC